MLRRITFIAGILFLVLNQSSVQAQILYYTDAFFGGVTADGYAPGEGADGTGAFHLHFHSKATIRKAILFSGDHNSPTPITISLNGNSLTFDNTTIVSSGFKSFYGTPASIHAIDVTALIDPSSGDQTLTAPFQGGSPMNVFTDFYLLVSYEFPGAFWTRVSMFLDTTGFQKEMDWVITDSIHTHSKRDLALGIYAGYMCDREDGEEISCNSTRLGLVFGPPPNSGSCAGPYANFYYERSALFGIGDCKADQQMDGHDVLSNIRAIVAPGDKILSLKMIQDADRTDNSVWGVVLVDGDTTCTGAGIFDANPSKLDFGSKTICASEDSITILIANLGCDTLSLDQAIAALDTNYTVSGYSPKLLASGDSEKITVFFSPKNKGIKTGSILFKSHSLHGGAIDSMVVPITGSIGDGSRILSAPQLLDFGTHFVCDSSDSTIIVTNLGCDTLRIDTLTMTGSGFVFRSIPLPVIILPDEKVSFSIGMLPDTTGGKTSAHTVLNFISNADNSATAVTLQEDYRYPQIYHLAFQHPEYSGSAGDSIDFELETDADLSKVRSIDLDITDTSDLLQFIGWVGSDTVTHTKGHLHITGTPYIISANGIIATVRYKVFLTKDSTLDLAVHNVQFDSSANLLPSCEGILNVSGTLFNYHYNCGDHSIGAYMGGKLPLEIIALRPNPASEEIALDVYSAYEGEVTMIISDALGIVAKQTTMRVTRGAATIAFDISALTPGIYNLTLQFGRNHAATHFIKSK